jgi:hypothetical protein
MYILLASAAISDGFGLEGGISGTNATQELGRAGAVDLGAPVATQ